MDKLTVDILDLIGGRSSRMEFPSIDVNPFLTVVQMIALNCSIEVTLLKEETAFDEDQLVSASLRQLERH
ncbi:hypothetical protein CEXT_186081 [Caerostris extrusa]|uniref:Carrier domain-containing protein n=1 Tax=Caerostris extrusa TaxID=172846 RepID=A0AAV4TXK4_CAEEX|nr:hypothetical protein CEXT_186081 [Caerostris extrusa]